jgi:uncharacterized membrane protein YvbJ
MFCPQCGSENNLEKGYCRQCGLSLTAVRLALDGRVQEAIKISDGDRKLWRYRLRVGIASLFILIAIATIVTGGKIGFSNIQSAAFVLIIIMILFIHVSRKSHRIARLLGAEDQSIPNSARDELREATRDTNVLAPSSITEQSTIKLKPDGRIKKQQ